MSFLGGQTMESHPFFRRWYFGVSLILVVVGFVFTIFGFTFFPEQILPRTSLLPWVTGIYGAIMIGWAVTLFIVGRHAFKKNDRVLLLCLIPGIGIWLLIEVIVSFLTGVYFNIGVDVVVFALFSIPIWGSSRISGSQE